MLTLQKSKEGTVKECHDLKYEDFPNYRFTIDMSHKNIKK